MSGFPMPGLQQRELSEGWVRTRRNVIGMWSILAGALLSGCKGETIIETRADLTKPNCYMKKTRILTPQGERRIEELRIGDLVTNLRGEATPIRWIGRRRYTRPSDEEWSEGIRPIRIARGALQRNVPHADLFVSQDHRLYFDGLLIRAAEFVNGTSVALASCGGAIELEYLHIMTRGHNIIFAEGLPSETLLFNDSSVRSFDNFSDYEQRYGGRSSFLEQPFAPVYANLGRRARLCSHLRSALSPWIDRRSKFDKVRDYLARQNTLGSSGNRVGGFEGS
jgi:Hint domain